jgi:DNA-binding NarL/FixJ family response regulator
MMRRAGTRLAVLISEDHPSTRLGIRRILVDEFPGIVIGEAGDAATTLAMLAARPWQLLVLDISLPDRHGLDVLGDVKRTRPEIPVLIYSAHPEDQFGVHAFRAGAAGYLTKERAPEELCVAVRTILRVGVYAREFPHANLSTREFQVLQLTAHGHTGKAIAGTLGVSQKTVSTYRARVLKKLGMSSVAELVRYAIEHDLV